MSKQLILDSLIGNVVNAGMKINWVSAGTKDKSVIAVIQGITGLINNGKLKVIGTYAEAQEKEAVPVDLVALIRSLRGDGTYEVPECTDAQYHVFSATIFPRWVNEGASPDSLAGMFTSVSPQQAGGLY